MIALITYPRIDPVIFRVGPVAVRWYGLAYLLGFALAYLTLLKLIKAGTLKLTADGLSDLMGWLIVGVVAGGRLGWWLFYHRPTGTPEPWYEPIALWHGGMSFHGGLIGVMLALFIWSRVKKADGWNLSDCCALVTPIGLFFGRIANFINAELVGRPSNVPWAMIFPGETVPRHPSQLYEALLEGPVLLSIVWLTRLKLRPREGQVSAMFLIAYGAIRFGVEFTREPDAQLGYIAFGWLTMGQLLSVTIALAGVILWFVRGRTGKPVDLQ